MCDTLVALGNATIDGSVIFGKNSDRPPNESQVIRRFPAMKHARGQMLRCTYLEIPQAGQTYEVLLSCPFWMWGAEMGVNEWGVAIGNEAVWSKEKYADTGLLGMDLVRLGLERGQTATEALQVMTRLLEEHGQGGNCFFNENLTYHNAFIIADPFEAWVLETADRQWAAQRVEGVRSISNGYTIGRQWDLSSSNLVENAVSKGWCQSETDFDFARCYKDDSMEKFVHCCERAGRSQGLLDRFKGKIDVRTMMGFLKDHEGYSAEEWNPDRQEQTICMHSGPEVISHSTASCVGHLRRQERTHWLTGGSTPCLSIYIPFYTGTNISEIFSRGGEKYADDAFWWLHEKLVRFVQKDYPNLSGRLISDNQSLQDDFIKEEQNLIGSKGGFPREEKFRALETYTKTCTERVLQKQRQGLDSFKNASREPGTKENYLEFLKELNKAAGLSF